MDGRYFYRIHEVDFPYEPTVDKGINFYTPASRLIIEQALQRTIEHGESFDVELKPSRPKTVLGTRHLERLTRTAQSCWLLPRHHRAQTGGKSCCAEPRALQKLI